jgi:cyclophilin family peptidyl-prolyl cis-trans isomerase
VREPVSGRSRAWNLLFPLILAATAAAQEPVGERDVQREPLCAEVATTHHLLPTNQPIWIRFTLRNTSDEPVRIPLPAGAATNGGIALPAEVVFGSADSPALTITYEAERPATITPPTPEEPVGGTDVLVLAPRGSIGTEIDLREHFLGLRYAGHYRLEWSPLDGRLEPAVVEFRVEPRKEAILVTDKGKITFTLAYDTAPRNVENFLDLVREGFYDGKTIHRVIPGFLFQGGCSKGDGSGVRPDGKLIPAEFSDAPFVLGTLAMARKPSDPNSASCQFLVTLARAPELDGEYTIIGQATDEESMRTLAQIAAEPTDGKWRPRLPLVIRSINLVDVDQSSVTHLELKGNKPTAPATSTPAAETEHEEP